MASGDLIPMLVGAVLAALRVAAMVMVAPVFSHRSVPVKVRLLVALAAGVGLASRGSAASVSVDAASLLAAGLGEVLIGAVIGYAGGVMLAGVALGAFHVGQQMGLTLAGSYDPSAESGQSPVGSLMGLLAAVVFLSVGGHRALLSAAVTSFESLPMGAADAAGLLATTVGVLSASFVLAMKVAAPALAAMLVVTAALGLLQRSVPQMHLLSVGLPVRAAAGAIALAAGLAVLAPAVEWGVDMMTDAFSAAGLPAGA
jgi:flagellar biosynthetic protein FliR